MMAPRRLSHSSVWQIPRKLPRHAADLAAYCANVVAGFVNSQPASIVPNILILNCRNGEFAFLVFRTLVDILSSKLESFVFILADPSRDYIMRCQSYFERRNFSNFNNLEFSVYDPEYDTECRFSSGRRFKPEPTAVIAESLLLDRLRFDVFSMRDGKLFEGLVQVDSCRQWEPDLQDEEIIKRSRIKLSFSSVDLAKTPYYTGEHKPLNRILEQAEEEGGEHFCVPVGAFDAILNLLHITRGNFMLMAIDDCPNVLQLPGECLRKSLRSAMTVLGGSIFSNKLSPNSALVCFGKYSPDAVSAFNHIVGDGSIPNLQDFKVDINILTALWLLEHSQFDPEVFIRLEGRLQYSDAPDDVKNRLQTAVLNVFERRFLSSVRHCLAIGRLLMDMKLWEQASVVWRAIIAEYPQDKLTASYHLAVCYNNLGLLEDARRTIDKSLQVKPFDENFRQLKLELCI